MGVTYSSVIHLGNYPDLDPVEGNNSAELQSNLIGSYFDSSDPAHDHIATILSIDANEDHEIQGDRFGGAETIQYDVGSGLVTTVLDFAATVQVDIAFDPASGEPNYVGIGGIIQSAEGDLFLVMIDDDFGLGANSLDDFPVVSISVTSVVSSGQNQNKLASDDQDFVTCFARGTQIQTSLGTALVENLNVGDLVQTAQCELQPVRLILKTAVSARQITQNAKLRPVKILAGALGQGIPSRDLWVSRQHRMLASSPLVRRIFHCAVVFIPAIKLTALPGIFVDDQLTNVEYFHIVLDEHHVIFAEGAPTESFHAGAFALDALSEAAKDELTTLFPKLVGAWGCNLSRFPTPTNKKQNEFVTRCAKNNKQVLSSYSGIGDKQI